MCKGDQEGDRPLAYKMFLANEEKKVDVMALSVISCLIQSWFDIHSFTYSFIPVVLKSLIPYYRTLSVPQPNGSRLDI